MSKAFWGASDSALSYVLGASNPYAAYALAFDPKNGQYWASGTSYASALAMPGASYTRSGIKAEPTATGVSAPFAANVPAIVPGVGYYSEGAFTNQNAHSSNISAWGFSGGIAPVGSGSSSNTATAPDGTQTADFLCEATSSAIVKYAFDNSVPTDAANKAFSVFLKAGGRTKCRVQIGADASNTGVYANIDLATGTIGAATVVGSGFASAGTPIITPCGNGWYRCTVFASTPATAHVGYVVLQDAGGNVNYIGDGVSGLYVWQAQLVTGALPGPIIPTTTAAASVGADALSFTVPSGTYSAVYTFSDGTTQTISTTVASNTFTMPLYSATLNKPAIALVTLT